MSIEYNAYHRPLPNIPGYDLRDPVGILVINNFLDEIHDSYTAIFPLPAEEEAGFVQGITVTSTLENIALEQLGRKVTGFYQVLQQKEELSSLEALQKGYLESILQAKLS